MLSALNSRFDSAEELKKSAKILGFPCSGMRGGLCELIQAGLANQKDDSYELSPKEGGTTKCPVRLIGKNRVIGRRSQHEKVEKKLHCRPHYIPASLV